MFKPITELGVFFSDECDKLYEFFRTIQRNRSNRLIANDQSSVVRKFFESINSILPKIQNLEFSLTTMFEIDQAICGSYGSKIFVEYSESPMRTLLRDLIALWYRYELLSNLERINPEYFEVSGIKSYYDEWLKSERVGLDITEYERILKNVVFLLENEENLDTQTRIMIFTIFGNILITLGVSKEDVDKTLQKYIYDIKDRLNPPLIAFSEILLNLHVYYHLGFSFNTLKSVNFNELIKAIRYWSSTSEFSDSLFKSWGLFWQNDYFSKLTDTEKSLQDGDVNSLNYILKRSTTRTGIGHSYLEFIEHKKKNPGLANIFKPVPIFMFGNSNIGKSSFLMSFCYDIQMRISQSNDYSNNLSIGKEFQSFYQNNYDNWQRNSMNSTRDYSNYTFWEDLNTISYMVTDYGGGDSQPDQWDPKLQNLFLDARSLTFFIDINDLVNPVNLRRQASIFDAFLQYWIQSNSNIKNIPIALIITKCDQYFEDNINLIKKSYLVPDELNPNTIDVFFRDRIESFLQSQLNNQYPRFKDCILSNKNNNVHPMLQDLVDNLLENFGQFFTRVLEITYHYQIFLTASIPPKEKNDQTYPYGVRTPLTWISKILLKAYNHETLDILKTEESQISKTITQMQEDIKRMYALNNRLLELDQNIKEARSAPTWNLLKLGAAKLNLADWEKQKAEYESEIDRLFQMYNEQGDSLNRKLTIEKIEKNLLDLEKLFNELKNKKNYLEINAT